MVFSFFQEKSQVLVVGLLIGALVGGISSLFFSGFLPLSHEQAVKAFYEAEYASHVSPIVIKNAIDSGVALNYYLVDVRSETDYNKEHIKGAVNIPVSWNESHILSAFQSLPKDKDILLYCYSGSCTAARKVGYFLSQHGIYARDLTIGWAEWRYIQEVWTGQSDWNATELEKYVEKGNGTGNNEHGMCQSGKFGC